VTPNLDFNPTISYYTLAFGPMAVALKVQALALRVEALALRVEA